MGACPSEQADWLGFAQSRAREDTSRGLFPGGVRRARGCEAWLKRTPRPGRGSVRLQPPPFPDRQAQPLLRPAPRALGPANCPQGQPMLGRT
eukprot:CAMPEP_0195096520 /NCGR_PEP_ID=MMETSP0448-20130528/51599_1 /TAXON_ID=66468 /ORGANISM="Heterocapsa triquestra, Strain CCMP 448" /LENGTH=91 /DNA_ID=CAMNT_0040130911 /DNA_START=105 /DNA_END=376 /DNA_ORIENTATION=+